MIINERILHLINKLELTRNSFCNKIGVNPTIIHNITKGRNKPSFDVLEKILLSFDNVSAEWLMKESGPMFKNDNLNDNLSDNLSDNLIDEKYEQKPESSHVAEEPIKWNNGFQAPSVVTVDNHGVENIVMLDAKAAAGFPANIDNPEYFKDKPTLNIPTHQFMGGSFIALQAVGDSMHPTVYNHDWLFCKFLEDPINNIREGYIHVLLTKDGVVVKRLLNRIKERGTVVCQSDNMQYPSYEEKLDNILQIWKVEAKLSFILRNEGADLNSRLNTLEGDMVEIKRLLKG